MSRYITTESFFDPTTCETVVTFRIADSLVRIAPSSDSLAEAVEQARAAMLRACLVYGLDEDFIDAEVVDDVRELPRASISREQFVIEAAVGSATELGGRPRFYPPYKHPAHYRQRVMLAKLQTLRARTAEPQQADEAIEYCKQKIEQVEEAQARDLQAFVEITRKQMARPPAVIVRQLPVGAATTPREPPS